MIARHRLPSCSVALSLALTSMVARAGAPVPAPAVVSPSPAPATEDAIPLRLALAFEAASGVVTGAFHNQLVGARLDGRFSPRLSLGAYLGLADLKGKDGRARAALTYAQLEYLAGDLAAKVRVPVRFASGWLAANGPVVRVSTGIAVAVGQKVDLVGELASMIWLTNNQNLISLDLSLEAAYKF